MAGGQQVANSATLFSLCLAAAAAQGITMRDIEEELGTDVRTIIYEALMNDPNDEFEALFMGRRHWPSTAMRHLLTCCQTR